MLTEAAGPLGRRDYAALRTLSGVAPVTKRSGKTCIVVMRYAAQVRLRNAVFHWARVAVLNDPKCRGRYEALRARGHSYGRALRGVADRLLGVACVLLQRQGLFDPDHGSAGSAVDTGHPLVRPEPTSLRPDLPRRSAARKRGPGGRAAAPAPRAGAQRPGRREHGAMLEPVGKARASRLGPAALLDHLSRA